MNFIFLSILLTIGQLCQASLLPNLFNPMLPRPQAINVDSLTKESYISPDMQWAVLSLNNPESMIINKTTGAIQNIPTVNEAIGIIDPQVTPAMSDKQKESFKNALHTMLEATEIALTVVAIKSGYNDPNFRNAQNLISNLQAQKTNIKNLLNKVNAINQSYGSWIFGSSGPTKATKLLRASAETVLFNQDAETITIPARLMPSIIQLHDYKEKNSATSAANLLFKQCFIAQQNSMNAVPINQVQPLSPQNYIYVRFPDIYLKDSNRYPMCDAILNLEPNLRRARLLQVRQAVQTALFVANKKSSFNIGSQYITSFFDSVVSELMKYDAYLAILCIDRNYGATNADISQSAQWSNMSKILATGAVLTVAAAGAATYYYGGDESLKFIKDQAGATQDKISNLSEVVQEKASNLSGAVQEKASSAWSNTTDLINNTKQWLSGEAPIQNVSPEENLATSDFTDDFQDQIQTEASQEPEIDYKEYFEAQPLQNEPINDKSAQDDKPISEDTSMVPQENLAPLNVASALQDQLQPDISQEPEINYEEVFAGQPLQDELNDNKLAQGNTQPEEVDSQSTEKTMSNQPAEESSVQSDFEQIAAATGRLYDKAANKSIELKDNAVELAAAAGRLTDKTMNKAIKFKDNLKDVINLPSSKTQPTDNPISPIEDKAIEKPVEEKSLWNKFKSQVTPTVSSEQASDNNVIADQPKKLFGENGLDRFNNTNEMMHDADEYIEDQAVDAAQFQVDSDRIKNESKLYKTLYTAVGNTYENQAQQAQQNVKNVIAEQVIAEQKSKEANKKLKEQQAILDKEVKKSDKLTAKIKADEANLELLQKKKEINNANKSWFDMSESPEDATIGQIKQRIFDTKQAQESINFKLQPLSERTNSAAEQLEILTQRAIEAKKAINQPQQDLIEKNRLAKVAHIVAQEEAQAKRANDIKVTKELEQKAAEYQALANTPLESTLSTMTNNLKEKAGHAFDLDNIKFSGKNIENFNQPEDEYSIGFDEMVAQKQENRAQQEQYHDFVESARKKLKIFRTEEEQQAIELEDGLYENPQPKGNA